MDKTLLNNQLKMIEKHVITSKRLKLVQDMITLQQLHYIAMDISKQQTLDNDPKAMQQINFTANLDQAVTITIFFIIEETR